MVPVDQSHFRLRTVAQWAAIGFVPIFRVNTNSLLGSYLRDIESSAHVLSRSRCLLAYKGLEMPSMPVTIHTVDIL